MTSEEIETLLPQTQCRQCGYDGCAPYAAALAEGIAAINLCTPGGGFVIGRLAEALGKPPLPPAQAEKAAEPKKLAYIDENECIGCTACIKACPVDAIVGASRQMHTVLADECTGCELCLPPCPVDCILLLPVADPFLPRVGQDTAVSRTAAAQHARRRYRNRTLRQQRRAAERQAHLDKQRTQAAPKTPTASPADLIARAMAAAQAKHSQRAVPANRDRFRREQIAAEQEKAAYRRAQRDLRYGSEAEKQAAVEYLRRHKQNDQTKD